MSSFKLLVGALFVVIMAVPALAAEAPTPTPAPAPAAFTDSQKAAIEETVRNLLIKKEPDIIIKAAQEVQNRQEAESSVKNQQALTANRDKIFNDASAPIGGNPKGNVTVVEFYDYQCGYCKVSVEAIQKLLAGDKNVKLVYKEFPILGPNSVQAAKASLASVRQGKFEKFHNALMTDKEHLSDESVFKIAKTVGLDVEKLKKDMADPAIDKMIKDNQALGSEIGAHGTPTFVIGDEIYPGAMQFDALKKAVDDTRAGAKK
jgi:protein-disulfide isomerase